MGSSPPSQMRKSSARRFQEAPKTKRPKESSKAMVSRSQAAPMARRARRVGAAAFLFFLVKGLLWLLIPAGLFAWKWWGGE